MDEVQWARWMNLIERGENGKPASYVDAYIINDDPTWDDAERNARIAALKRFLRTEHHTDKWVIFEHADGRKEIVWPS